MLVYNMGMDQAVCRTRTHDTSELFEKISDISIAPNWAYKNFARCNSGKFLLNYIHPYVVIRVSVSVDRYPYFTI